MRASSLPAACYDCFRRSGRNLIFGCFFSTDSRPVTTCTVIRAGNYVSKAYVGHGRFGLDFELGIVRETIEYAVSIFEDLKKGAVSHGFNTVIGARIEVSHTGDAVFETGQN